MLVRAAAFKTQPVGSYLEDILSSCAIDENFARIVPSSWLCVRTFIDTITGSVCEHLLIRERYEKFSYQ